MLPLARTHAHPEDSRIRMDASHRYWLDDEIELASVSRVIAQHFSEFNAPEMSLRMAPQIFSQDKYTDYATRLAAQGLGPDSCVRDVAAGLEKCWEIKRDNGTARHALQEQFWNLHTHSEAALQSLWPEGQPLDVVHRQCLAFAAQAYSRGWTVFRTEWCVSSKEFRVAGTVDAVFRDDKGRLWVVDWKFEDNASSVGWRHGSGPCHDLRESKRNKHFLQVNCYRVLLEKYGLDVAGCVVVTFSAQQTSFLEDPAPDWRQRATDVLGTSPCREITLALAEHKAQENVCDLSLQVQEFTQLLLQGQHLKLDAVPGAGKTLLATQVAAAFPNHVVLTYNRDLVDRLVQNKIRAFTFHALLGQLTDTTVPNDVAFMQQLTHWREDCSCTAVNLDIDLLVLDEAQDLRALYAEFVTLLLQRQRGGPVRLLVMGDPHQLLYDYILGGSADSRFLTSADTWLGTVCNGPWAQRSLSRSLRCPDAAAQMVCQLRPGLQFHGHPAGQVVVQPCFLRNDAPQLVVQLAKQHPELFVLARSLRKGSVSVPVANALRRAGCNTVRLLTMHAAKGLQAECVVVLCEEPLRAPISNALYVALTRASHLLVVLHDRFSAPQRANDKVWVSAALARCDPRRLQTMTPLITVQQSLRFEPIPDGSAVATLALQLHYGRLLPRCDAQPALWQRVVMEGSGGASDLLALSNALEAEGGYDAALEHKCDALTDASLRSLLTLLPVLNGNLTFGTTVSKGQFAFHVTVADSRCCVAFCELRPDLFASMLAAASGKRSIGICLATGELVHAEPSCRLSDFGTQLLAPQHDVFAG